jgi:hypothetical protein
MKSSILICALLIGIASARVTNLETMKAWNFFRQHPGVVASWIEKKYISKGINGVYGDKNCFTETVRRLKSQQPQAPLTEAIGLDLAATQHARYLLSENKGKLTHDGKSGSDTATVKKRIEKFSYPTTNWVGTEMLTAFNQEKLVAANDILLHLVTDCGNENNGNYNNVFSSTSKFTHAGVGIALVGDQTIGVLLMSKGVASRPVKNEVLTQAEIEGNGDYFGKGESMPSTSPKTADAFKHTGKEIYPQLNTENVATDNGPLGDLVDDKSVKCPTWVNPSNYKKDGYFRDWKLVSPFVKCERGKGDFPNTNNLQRTAPFAKGGKCYHRLSYCSTGGQVWVKDREYETLAAVDAGAAHKPQHPILKNYTNDKTVDCPPFVNGPLLRKRFVQVWYLNGADCSAGEGIFDKDGFHSKPAIAIDHKCFHRVMFCDKKGRTWVQDSEYKTLAEWNAEKH